jgi:signal transduction histidine kinase
VIRGARSQIAWLVFGVFGFALIAAYYLARGAAQAWIYDSIGLVSLSAMIVGIRWHRPERPAAWWLLVGGQALFFLGDLTWNVYQYVLHVELPSPSFADALYLAGYPCILLALWLLLRRRGGSSAREGWLDAGVVAAATAVIVWVFVVDAYEQQLLHSLEAVIAVAYPIWDIAMVCVLARLFFAPGARPPAFRLLVLSIIALLIGDIGYAVVVANGTYQAGTPIAAGWFLSYVLLGAATLHPSMRQVSERTEGGERLTRGRMRFLAALSLTPLAAYVVGRATGVSVLASEVATGSAFIFLLVFARMSGLLRQVDAGRSQIALRDAERGKLLDRATRGAEDERRRLAAELHDGPIQHLAGLDYKLERTLLRLERGDTQMSTQLVGEVGERLEEEIHMLRRMMTDLRPPVLTERGLAEALRDHAAQVAEGTGIEVEIEAGAVDGLDPEQETTLYRVGQEALANALQHSGARHIQILLRNLEAEAELKVIDDGVGFDPDGVPGSFREDRFGLMSMRERLGMAGGSLDVLSDPGHGTTICARLPFRSLQEVGA